MTFQNLRSGIGAKYEWNGVSIVRFMAGSCQHQGPKHSLAFLIPLSARKSFNEQCTGALKRGLLLRTQLFSLALKSAPSQPRASQQMIFSSHFLITSCQAHDRLMLTLGPMHS